MDNIDLDELEMTDEELAGVYGGSDAVELCAEAAGEDQVFM